MRIEERLQAPLPLARFALLLLLGGVVSTLALRFFFPGYLAPFQPFHIDHFVYIGMHAEGYGLSRYIVAYPRPLAHILIDLCGRLGPRWMLAPIYLGTLVNAALLILYVERIVQRRIALVGILAFLTLSFCNPQYNWSFKQDPFAVPSFTCLLATFHFWQSYVENGKRWQLGGAVVSLVLLTQIKEPYCAALVLFFVLQAVGYRRLRVPAVMLAAVSTIVSVLALARNAHVWGGFQASSSAGGSYHVNLSPESVLNGFLTIGKSLFYPAPAVIVVACIVFAGYRELRMAWIAGVSVVLAASSLLANAILPNHLEDQYAWLGAFLFFTPVLVAADRIPSGIRGRIAAWAASGAVCFFALVGYASPFPTVASWMREQEQFQRKFLMSLPVLQGHSAGRQQYLVCCIATPYNAFRAAGFVRSEFGSEGSWTVVVPDELPESTEGNVRAVHASAIPSLAFDRLFVYSPDGTLRSVNERPDLVALERSDAFPFKVHFVALNQETLGKDVLRANPNPIRLSPGDHSGTGTTTIHWNVPGVDRTEVHVNSPDGPVFTRGAARGEAQTDKWVTDGMTFYLQDVTGNKGDRPTRTLAKVTVRITPGVGFEVR